MKKKPVVYLIILMVTMIMVIGLSTAYFMAQVFKNGDSANVIMLTKTLGMRFTDGPEVVLNGALPGQKIIKTFTVENTGNTASSYNLSFVDVTNPLSRRNDLVYTISSTNGGYSNNTETIVPADNYTFAENISIPANTTQEYTLTIEYKNFNENQNIDMDKKVSFKINIDNVDKKYGAKLAAGLYDDNDELIYSWDELIEQNYIKVSPVTDSYTDYYDFDYNDGDMVLSQGSNHCAWNDTDCNLLAGKIVIDDSIVYMESPFEYSAVKSAYIPANVKIISSAFRYTKNLTSVTFAPNSQLLVLGGFERSGLTSIEIPSSVTTIASGAFTDAKSLESVTFEPNSSLRIIESRAFESTAITSFDIPEGVIEIWDDPFNSTKIASINIPASVESLGDYAFYDLDNLTSVTFAPNSHLTSIGYNAFITSNHSLKYLNIPSSVTSIGTDAFSGVTAVIYHGSAEDTNSDNWGAISLNPYIDGDYVFDGSNSTNLVGYIGTSNSISIPSGTTIISNSAFEHNKLTSVAIPASVTTIGDSAFACNYDDNYDSDISLTFAPNSQLSNLGTDIFSYCAIVSIDFGTRTNLTSINFSSLGIGTIGSLVLPNGITSVDSNTFNSVYSINSITLPSTLRTIGNNTFEYKNLTSVTFAPNCQLTTIGEYAFSDSGLTSITIPASVTSIGYRAFNGINTIYYSGSAPDTYEDNWGAYNRVNN